MSIKVNSIVPNEIQPVTHNTTFGEVTVKQYLPIDEKLKLIGRIAGQAHDADYNFCNPLKLEAYLNLFLIWEYSDLEFEVDENGEMINPQNVYDALKTSGLMDTVLNFIPADEKRVIYEYAQETIDSIYAYQNSAMGILENLAGGYEGVDFDLTALQEKMKELADSDTIKAIMSKQI